MYLTERSFISMARSADPDSAGSQFFIVIADAPHLDRQYTVFGRVSEGMDVADKIVAALSALDSEAEDIRDAMGRTVARNLRMMARMGVYFEERVARQYPEFPIRTGVLGWEEYLPPLAPELCKLLEDHSGVLAA